MKTGGTVPGAAHHRSFTSWLWLGLQAELALFRRPMLVLSVLAIVLAPTLYAVFYISSFWDPYSHLDRLPAALVNIDRGVATGGREVNLGNDLVDSFQQKPPFRFVRFPSVAAADEALHRGDVYFTLVIPEDFSARALAARKGEPATLTLQAGEGASYTSTLISKRFGAELAHALNEQLNGERWAAIVGDPSAAATDSLRVVIGQLRDGSQQVHQGAQRLQAGSGWLDQGFGQVAAGLQQMRDRLPTGGQLQELADGSKAVVAGAEKLTTGFDQLAAGGERLQQGAEQLRQGAAKVPFGGAKVVAGAARLETGIATLDTNLLTAAAGSRELQAGLTKLNDGVQPLTGGLVQLEAGLQQLSSQFSPTNSEGATNQPVRLSEGSRQLVAGSQELEAGTAKLADGLNRLDNSLTEKLGGADANALAASVQVDVETYAPVQNNGTAYSPYFAALALWLGGIMITFVFHCRRLIEPMKAAPRWVCWLAKSAVPLGLGVLQATVVVAVLRLGFGVAFVHLWLVWLAAALGSVTFVSIILLLIAVFGDAGRLPAVVLLILQLAAAGGIYPVELSGRFYEAIHPYLPLTALVNAFRATMFGAYESIWSAAALQLAVTAGVAVVLAIWFARWKYVSREAYGPAVEFN
ncbi:MAG TPA: YhgE/Pip domain-containing protein [Candidatus Acidoferrales bacterium]|jgi:putative membrane protein|nr:YhgE/Pip domain-containing protein [Candidatus Acidoferrales bacterium]